MKKYFREGNRRGGEGKKEGRKEGRQTSHFSVIWEMFKLGVSIPEISNFMDNKQYF